MTTGTRLDRPTSRLRLRWFLAGAAIALLFVVGVSLAQGIQGWDLLTFGVPVVAGGGLVTLGIREAAHRTRGDSR